MLHAALLLLMLGAAITDLVFTISLKRSTPILQLSTSWPADYPIYRLAVVLAGLASFLAGAAMAQQSRVRDPSRAPGTTVTLSAQSNAHRECERGCLQTWNGCYAQGQSGFDACRRDHPTADFLHVCEAARAAKEQQCAATREACVRQCPK
ncbi:MAG TPA: hypothetical protein VE224_19830 [Pseudolabrys sp.]|nr:hypothetical protein [Pseudolabrys sp.]